MKKLLLAITFCGVTMLNAQTVVLADTLSGFNPTDATINFYSAIVSQSGTGNTLVFRDMGTPWIVSPCLRMFDVDNLTIIFEEGFVLQESTLYAKVNERRNYANIGKLIASYPNGVEIIRGSMNQNTNDGDYDLSPNSKLFWVNRSNDLTVKAYGAEFIGSFPTLNLGNDPDTRATKADNSSESSHWLQIEVVGNFIWSGGYVHNWGGDGFNLVKLNNDCIIEDAKIYYNKRLGTQSHSANGTLTVRDCDISFNGRGQNVSTDFGTNTRHGSTWEPNKPGESVQGIMTNCRFFGNGDSGVGLHVAKIDDTAIKDINFMLSDCHLENNGTQVDYTRAGAFTLSGTDLFTDDDVDSERGLQPLGGAVSITNVAVWGDTYGFLFTGNYKGSYSVSFDETVVYKVSTTNAQSNTGEGIVEWKLTNELPNGTRLADFDFGNLTLVHEYDEFFIDLDNSNNVTQIENTVTGNLTLAMNSTKPLWSINSPLTNNSSLTETRYALNALPINEVNVQATSGNAIKSSNTNGEFTFTRTGSTDFPMAVAYDVVTSGINAEMLNDFKLLRGSAVIPTGQTSVTVPVIPLNPNRTGGSRNIMLTIQPKTDLYTVGSNSSATVTLLDNGGTTAQTATLDPIHDAHLEGSVRKNQTRVKMQQNNRVGYLKFDLSSVNGTISSAELHFRVNGDTGIGTAEIYKGTTSSWTETNLSTSNKPAKNGLLGSTTDIGQTTTNVVVILSAGTLTGGGDLSLIVEHVGSDDFWMASKENTFAPGPQLVVTYEPSTNVPVTGVTIAPGTLAMETGDTDMLTAAVVPSNSTDQGVSWSSSDTAIATVDASGLVTAIAVGSATITVTTDDGNFTAATNVTVTSGAPIVSNITVSDIMEDSFKVSWNLNEGSKGRIEYGTSSGNYTEQTTLAENFLTFHLQTVGNNNAPPLQSGTTYYWQIRTEDVDGNVGYSDEQTTTTASPQPQTVTLGTIHDAHLEGSLRKNQTRVKMQQNNRVGYLKFDLSSVNGTISSAELHFRVNGDTGIGTAEIYKGTTSSWTETNLSTSNKPAKNGLLGSTTDIGQTTTHVVVILSAGILTGGGDLSLIVEHVGSDDFWMASKENTFAPGPELVVTYIPNSGSSLKARVDFDNSDSVSGITSLFPNPTTSEVQLYGIDGEKEITVIDFSGKLFMEATSQEAEPVIDLSGYAPGIYYMRVESSGISKTFKVVKQ